MDQIQILAIREHAPGKKAQVWFERGLRAPSVESIFLHPEKYIQSLKPSERHNIYYTVSECIEEPGRKLHAQHHIPFDIDKLDPLKLEDDAHLIEIAKVVCSAIGVTYEHTGVMCSGNGIQVLVGIDNPIVETAYFQSYRNQYKLSCDRINLALRKAGFSGFADYAVWSPARLMRYPNTINQKQGKPDRQARVLQPNITRVSFSLEEASGAALPLPGDVIADSIIRQFPTPDVKTIMKECEYLKWMQLAPHEVSEPQWYAGLSVTSRFPNGREFSHSISQGHPSYSYEETELKINQALEASGPRTCKSFNSMSDKCGSCVHFNSVVVKSPIMIRGEDFISTAHTGFRFITDKGRPGAVAYHDLQKKFNQDYYYKTIDGTGIIYAWTGTHYEEFSRDRVLNYADSNVVPVPSGNNRSEFYSLVRIKNLVRPNWFQGSTRGKMNFRNGVLDVDTRNLSPHNVEYGFRSTLDCDFDPLAKAPLWEQFINDVTKDRKELANLLQEFMGYTFANQGCFLAKVLVLIGDGSNGKSTFVEVIRKLASPEGASNLSIKSLSDAQNRYLLEGKIMNLAEENDENSFKDAELIKNIASGGMVNVKKLYAQPYEFANDAKLIMLCNKPPKNSDQSHGFYRRFIIIPFDKTFNEKNADTRISGKLFKELPGIANWMLDGWARVKSQNGFTKSSVSTELLDEYQEYTDPTIQWYKDCVDVSSDQTIMVNKTDLYSSYTQWCERNGHRFPITASTLFKNLRAIIKRDFPELVHDIEIQKRTPTGRERFFKHVVLVGGIPH